MVQCHLGGVADFGGRRGGDKEIQWIVAVYNP
jgi:hypothetical protein